MSMRDEDIWKDIVDKTMETVFIASKFSIRPEHELRIKRLMMISIETAYRVGFNNALCEVATEISEKTKSFDYIKKMSDSFKEKWS